MRDFLGFEKHVRQAFGAARRLRAATSPDPKNAILKDAKFLEIAANFQGEKGCLK
jgi:hypothetical protein